MINSAPTNFTLTRLLWIRTHEPDAWPWRAAGVRQLIDATDFIAREMAYEFVVTRDPLIS